MFNHLHLHTEYSLLDGMCRIPALIERAAELGYENLAITDHGNMYGAIAFYRAAREVGIKPIIGCEVYVALESRHRRAAADRSSHHLVLLSKDQSGYRNLLALNTKAHLEGFYYKPRVDKELLRAHSGGLVALSACLGGEIPQLCMEERREEARAAARWYRDTFDDFYLELQRHDPAVTEQARRQEQVNSFLLELAAELDIPLVATNDLHYIRREDAPAHDLLLCIGTNNVVSDEKRLKMLPDDSYYLKSPEEMAALFPDVPEAIENTARIAAMCNLELEFGRLHLPEIKLPEGLTPFEYLRVLCREGLKHCYPKPTPEIEERLAYELDVIKITEFANYFLVVWDIVKFARDNGIMVGVRGSAAASIVLYCLGITEIDPLQHKLVFERFLNIERKEMPDIDLDFQDDRRDEVIEYLAGRWGQDHVAQIITFGTLGARAALRDVGRALGMPYGDVDRLARLVPPMPHMTLARALEESPELKGIHQMEEASRRLIDQAMKVEGIARHASTHAAGIVISREPLTDYVPLQLVSRGGDGATVMTQYPMGDIASIGLLKMDVLGLANLTTLSQARQIIRQSRGEEIDLQHLPMDDAATFALLASGETSGVFQLEGSGMRRYIKDLRPTTFSDIAAMVALYRPGPMEHIPTFIDAKHGRKEIQYPHPALKNILEETYGVIVYQDQVLFIVREFAGYSLGQADIFRKAMGKKIAEVMGREKENFVSGAVAKGFHKRVAEDVFALIEPFAGYAFNKAHSVSYALIAYQTAYLKANYPAEYMTALLQTNADVSEKVAVAIAECRRLEIKVQGPDINRSQVAFSLERDADGKAFISFGLGAVKNVGAAAVAPIITAREKDGEFRSVEDFCRRTDLRGLNRRVLESLIKVGALDCLGYRGVLLENIGRILELSQQEQQRRESGQTTMFDLWGEATPAPLANLRLGAGVEDIAIREKLAWEKELLGVYFSEHPFSSYAQKIGNGVVTLCGQIDADMNGKTVTIAGLVASARRVFTRDHKEFISVVLEDLDGSVEVTAWPKIYADTAELWMEGNSLLVRGKVRVRNDRIQVYADTVSDMAAESAGRGPAVDRRPVAGAAPPPKPLRRLVISIVQSGDEAADLARLNDLVTLLKEFPGRDVVAVRVQAGGQVTNLRLTAMFTGYSEALAERLTELVGEGNYRLEDGVEKG